MGDQSRRCRNTYDEERAAYQEREPNGKRHFRELYGEAASVLCHEECGNDEALNECKCGDDENGWDDGLLEKKPADLLVNADGGIDQLCGAHRPHSGTTIQSRGALLYETIDWVGRHLL